MSTTPRRLYDTPLTVTDHNGQVLAKDIVFRTTEDMKFYVTDKTKPVFFSAKCIEESCGEMHTFIILYDDESFVPYGTLVKNIKNNQVFMSAIMAEKLFENLS